MQFKQTLVRLIFLILPFAAFSQTTYLPQGARENVYLERLEIQLQSDSILNFSKNKPLSRRYAYEGSNRVIRENHQLGGNYIEPTSVSSYMRHRLYANNIEFVGDTQKYLSRRRFLKEFYKTESNFYEVNTKDFFLALNPVLQFYVGKENNNNERIFLNTRGITFRGRIANKVGFAAYMADNQERDPLYVQQWEKQRKAVPGAGFYKSFKQTGYDYFDARGYITLSAAKFIDIQFGYDRNFIGNGYRSLFLSDFSNSYLFLKLNTRVWKFNYQNIFAELHTTGQIPGDLLIPKKYMTLHHLDMGVTKWLNIGLFEGIIFGRKDHFEFGYLNPVIFYRSVEQQNGSFDNAIMGVDAKANVAKKFQLYGQFLLDEFNLVELRKRNGWWANKYGVQLGAKYIDAFSIRNLDLQIEANRVRPFTYSHRDSVANYTHYNQPLAHPLGANFQEWIGMARFQPAPKWFLQAKAIYFAQGKDTANVSFGSNILLPNDPAYRNQDYGFDIGDPVKGKTALASLLVSYEWKPNFFIELNGVIRKESATTISAAKNSSIIYFGIRWNMHRREFDF